MECHARLRKGRKGARDRRGDVTEGRDKAPHRDEGEQGSETRHRSRGKGKQVAETRRGEAQETRQPAWLGFVFKLEV